MIGIGEMTSYTSGIVYLAVAMMDRLRETIKRHELLETGDTVLIGLSGGPDSVALLEVLVELREDYSLRLMAVYVNHGIRPAAAEVEELFCRELCRKFGVDFTLVRKEVPSLAKERGKGLEETAREVRYEVFETVADQRGCEKIAVGHHLDDQAETVLFRMIRGSGRTGLAGMPVRRGRIIRPLIDVSRQEIVTWLAERGQTYCEDRSNEDGRFTRNFLRNEVLPLLRERVNPNVSRLLAEMADTLAEEERYLGGVVLEAIERTVRWTPGGKLELDLTLYIAYDRWIRRRLLRHCLAEAWQKPDGPDKAVVDRLDQLCINGGTGLTLPGGRQATRIGERMVVHRIESPSYEIDLEPGGEVQLPSPALLIRTSVGAPPSDPIGDRRSNEVLVDRSKVALPLVVREIRRGDRFQPLGLQGTKKVGDYLTNRKVPAVLRDEIPLVCDRRGIIWLTGFEISERVKIDESTKEVLSIECITLQRGPAETV